MRNSVKALRFQLIRRVVEEEADQNSVHRSPGVMPEYFTSDELNTPDTTASQLDFPRMPVLNGS